jgi:predicted MFS family arabinose efflux permease
MSTKQLRFKKGSPGFLFLPTVLLAVFATFATGTMFQLTLMDIASSLNITVGTASQIGAVAYFAGLIAGLLVGVLTVRFNYKSAFLLGLSLVGLGSFGSSYAWNLISMQFFQCFSQAGFVIVGAMTFALIGEHLPLEKRGRAVGWVVSAAYISYIIESPVISHITNIAGWRSVLSWFVFPVSIGCFILAFLVLPAKSSKGHSGTKVPYLKAFKKLLSNKSAVACLICAMFTSAAATIEVYATSFFRSQFSITLDTGAIILMFSAASAALGSMAAGRLINRAGRKTLGEITITSSSLLVISFALMPNLWSSATLRVALSFCFGITLTALNALILEQVPEFRGAMMSLSVAFGAFGNTLGLTVGGYMLNLYSNNYQFLAMVLASFSLAAAAMLLLAKDPAKPNPGRS